MQVTSLKQEVEALHNDNTLLRNTLARAQQESAEYASRIQSMDDDSHAAEATERQHVASASAELEELKSVNVRLQTELGCCRQEVAEAHDRGQVCPKYSAAARRNVQGLLKMWDYVYHNFMRSGLVH